MENAIAAAKATAARSSDRLNPRDALDVRDPKRAIWLKVCIQVSRVRDSLPIKQALLKSPIFNSPTLGYCLLIRASERKRHSSVLKREAADQTPDKADGSVVWRLQRSRPT
jgi:hypothetical protein